jgi:hypothetical protein
LDTRFILTSISKYDAAGRAAPRILTPPLLPAHEVQHNQDQCEHEQQMDQAAGNMGKQPDDPEYDEQQTY